ncbi:MAG: DUF3179 domain-containing protein [Chloroflexi bacterium]|nr:DUF3179 domain-containing protein [Chloroflexota bacterium]
MQHPAILRLRATAPAWFLVCAALIVSFGACVSTDTMPTPAEARVPTPAADAAPTPTAAVSALVPSASPTPTAAVSALVPSGSPTPTAAVSALLPATPLPSSSDRNGYGVAVDADYAGTLSRAVSTRVWETDFRFHTVPYEEIISGGVGRDGIPPIDDPSFLSVAEADEWLADPEPVIALELNGEAKAYPLQILTWHEIVNDELAGVPVTATYCPLCNSAIVFERTLDGTVYDFGVSGFLRNSDLIMWDRQTQSWWQQLTGEAIAGELAGAQLRFVPAQLVSWETFAEEYPDGLALDRPGFGRPYGDNPYVNYDVPDSQPFLFQQDTDPRLPPKLRVAAVEINGDAVAFPYSVLAEERVVHHEVGGEDVVVFFEFGTTSALGRRSIPNAEDVGATGVFRPVLDGDRLTFALDGDTFTDERTGSTWNVLGRAVGGPLAGRQLERVQAQDHLWFAWAAFKPHTTVYGQG